MQYDKTKGGYGMKPKELTIRDEVIEGIRTEQFLPDKKLPSENELSDFYQVSRMTIRRVYKMLEEMGFIYSNQGVGHFVTSRREPIEVALKGETSFSEKMKQQNIPYESKTVSCEAIDYDRKIFNALAAAETDRVFKIVRVRTIYDKRSAIHTSYVREKNFPEIEKEGKNILSIFDYYRSKGHHFFQSHHSKLSVSFPTPIEQQLLNCHSLAPLISIESDCFDKEKNNILEYTKIVYRSDLLEISLAHVYDK